LAVDPEAYAKLANAAALQIRYHDPGSVVITGGLSPLFQPSSATGMRQSSFLKQMLPYLHANLFVGVAVHPYSWPVLPSRAATYNAFYTVNNGDSEYDLRAIMQLTGWGDKQIWGTEFGATTIGTSTTTRRTTRTRPDHVSEAVQAQIIEQGIADWYDKPNVGPLFVNADSDQWLPSYKNEGGFGLRRRNGTKKPSYAAFQEAVEQIQ
jgi:hypothetical protein